MYFRFSDADPYAASIQRPLGQVTGCFLTSNGNPANLTAEYVLLPGVLYGYKDAPTDLPTYVAPFVVPEPGTDTFLLPGLAAMWVLATRRRTA